jgi:hypothetical protein
LEAELADARVRVAALRADLVKGEVSPASERPASMGHVVRLMRSPAEKIKLFRELFRGRIDVYPTRFISQKTGKAGYAPACSNKFVRGVCELPKVKCGDCTKQAFRPVDASAIVAHLQGSHVMGVYPMLLDETCWFLAADFDKSTCGQTLARSSRRRDGTSYRSPLNARGRATAPTCGSSSRRR